MRIKSRLALLGVILAAFVSPPLRAIDGVTVRPANTGFFDTDLKYMVDGAPSEKVRIPVPFYVIRHPQGVVLFDSGLGTEFPAQLDGWWLHRLFQATLPYEFDPSRAAVFQLKEMGVPFDQVKYVVVSHLHYDHAGGLRDLPDAKVVVSRREWESANVGRWLARFRGVMSETLDGVADRLLLVDYAKAPEAKELSSFAGAYDLFGDGALLLLSTPGHTAGHQSLLVTTESGKKVLLAGDAVWVKENYQKPAPKSWIVRRLEEFDADQAWKSTLAIRQFSQTNPDALIVPGHDPKVFSELPAEIR